jgi:hypothetical protein
MVMHDVTSRMPLEDLVAAFRAERARFQRGETCTGAFGYELFRRAVCDGDDAAWAALLVECRALILAWVHRLPAYGAVREDDDYWVLRTLERFWIAVGAERWPQFPNLPALMRYLKLCAHSVVLDANRARMRTRSTSLEQLGHDQVDVRQDEDSVLGDCVARDLWQTILDVLNDDSERLVTYLSLVRGVQPRAIYRYHHEQFASVAEVYRTKRNALERIRRSPQLRQYAPEPQAIPV